MSHEVVRLYSVYVCKKTEVSSLEEWKYRYNLGCSGTSCKPQVEARASWKSNISCFIKELNVLNCSGTRSFCICCSLRHDWEILLQSSILVACYERVKRWSLVHEAEKLAVAADELPMIPLAQKSSFGNREWGGGGSRRGVFRNSWRAGFSLRGNLILQGNPYYKLPPTNGNYRAKTSLTNFPECFPHLFLLHFEPKTSHNARFWGPNTLVFWGHRAPTIWANKKEVSNGPQKVTDPIFVNPPPEGLLSADCKRGRKKGAARKLSKSVEKLFHAFWRFLTFFALRENCRKVSKNFLTLFDGFWRFLTWPLSAGPFCNPLILNNANNWMPIFRKWGYQRFVPTSSWPASTPIIGTGKRGHDERGLFTGGISRISLESL